MTTKFIMNNVIQGVLLSVAMLHLSSAVVCMFTDQDSYLILPIMLKGAYQFQLPLTMRKLSSTYVHGSALLFL